MIDRSASGTALGVRKTGVLLAIVLLAGSPLAAHAALAHRSAWPQVSAGQAADGKYVLGPDDQVAIHAVDVPDISDKPQRLDPNGDLHLPMVGRVHAAGMTLEQLREELTRRLKMYLVEPDVAVSMTEFRSQPVSVIGAVGTSGVRQLDGRKTLVEVLSMAGGVSTDAGPSVKITRRLEWGRIPLAEATEDTSGGFSVAEIDLKSLLKATSPEKNITIRPYDIISIPRAEFVYVVGEVAKPGALPLSGGPSVSIMDAVSASGGILRTAAPTHARIVRRIAGGAKRAEVAVDLKKIMQGKADDLPLLAGDILFVPDSNGKRITARSIEAVIQAGILVGTYGVIR